MQFFTGSHRGSQRFGHHHFLQDKALIFIVSLGLLSGISLVAHAAQLRNIDAGSSFGIIKATDSSAESIVSAGLADTHNSKSVTINVTQTADPVQAEQPTTTVTINNQAVPVPANGSVTKEITTENGQTTINVQTTSQSTDSSKRSTLHIQSSSHTTQNSSTQSIQRVNNQGDLQL